MHQRRTGLLALLVVVTLAVAAWWLWNLDAGGGPRANEEVVADSSTVQARREEPRVDPPATEPAKSAPETTTQPESKPEAQPEPAAYDEPAQAPVYGELLKRGGAVITFDLRDAQGQWLVSEPVTTKLIRKLGRYSIEEDCYWSFDDGTVVCDGESSAGLEPGNYELEVVAGNYGWLRHAFTVQRGEKAKHELRLPYWRRIITCQFNDLNGNPLPFLPEIARVETANTGPPEKLETVNPGSVLRKPPSRHMNGVGLGGGGRGGRGGGFFRKKVVWVTDGGRWHVAVFAGASNKISAEALGGVWAGENLVFEGTFDTAAAPIVEFRLGAPANLDQAYAEHTRISVEDPGHRSLLDWAARKGAHPALDDPSDVGGYYRRILVNISGTQGLSPRFALVQINEDGQPQPALKWDPQLYRSARQRNGQWFFDAANDWAIWMRLWDGAAFVTDPELVSATQTLTVVNRSVSATEVQVAPWPLPATVDGWAVHREFVTIPSDTNLPPHRDPSGLDGFAAYDLTRPRLLLAPDAETRALEETISRANFWRLGGSATRGGSTGWIAQWQWVSLGQLAVGGEAALLALKAGAQGPALKSGLYFRAVDASGAGLPWVEATLHALEDDPRAQRLRDLERRGHKDGWRPSLSTSFANAREDDPSGLNDDDLKRERVREFVGQDFERECKDDADLKFYLRTGAWYDSFTRLRGGEYGYHIDLERKLTPGKKYVLYLWSNSRDDLHPDARIVFQAAEVTDLGVITLPAYTE